ncbi:MAG: tetratricopeptide repeat protein [Synergistaceae bacterium]|nr:tetratricopeptide repeat protein [Synergistaceae bacterium]
MRGKDGDERRGGGMKRPLILFLALLLAAGLTLVPSAPLRADKYSPPDESVPESPSSDDAAARQEREKAVEIERRRKAEETARRAREKAAREARKAAEEDAARRRRETQEKALAASEDMVNRTIAAGRGLVESGRFQSAIGVFQRFLDNNPHSADGWYWISRAHHALGEYDRAQAALNIAIEIDPYYPLLAKTPSGLEPRPFLTKERKKEPRPSMSLMPVKPTLPANVALEPVTVSFPYLASGDLRYLPYPPESRGRTAAWMDGERFNEISRWRFRVDRMGILKEPRTAVAWKGTRPYEVYFWTGGEWARIRRNSVGAGRKARYGDIFYGAGDGIAAVLNARGFVWNESDTHTLAAAASLMRYMWMGEIDPGQAASAASDDIEQSAAD